MTSNINVIKAWTQGQPATAKNLRTDGNRLWSYGLIIAMTNSEVEQFTAKGNRGFFSMTTSRHVGMANRGLEERLSS